MKMVIEVYGSENDISVLSPAQIDLANKVIVFFTKRWITTNQI